MLTQKIAENINCHLLKQHDIVVPHDVDSVSVAAPQTVTSVDSVGATAPSELAATSSVATANTEPVCSRSKSTTSTADLSINDDSLMSALEVFLLPSI